MQIDHLALYVQDLETMKTFYIQYFGATANDKYHNPRTGLQTYFLTFESGSRLEIMTRPDIAERKKGQLDAGYIHLAFSVGSRGKVDELTHTLSRDGFRVASEPRTTGDGYYESCVLDPEGNFVEIVA